MFSFKSLSFILLLAISGNIFPKEIVKGKKYKTDDGDIVTVVGSCKEIWQINSLSEAGILIHDPIILRYLFTCMEDKIRKHIEDKKFFSESELDLIIDAVIEAIETGNREKVKIYLDEKYQGEFYLAEGGMGEFGILTLCVPSSELTPINDENSYNK